MKYFHLQVLCEDIYRPQGVGENGTSQPGWVVDRQLLERPDSACLGGWLKGVQSWVAGAWTCGRVYCLGPWECSSHHPGGHRLRGMWRCCWDWHLRTEDVGVYLVQLSDFPQLFTAKTSHVHWNNDFSESSHLADNCVFQNGLDRELSDLVKRLQWFVRFSHH